jgi:predicted permease
MPLPTLFARLRSWIFGVTHRSTLERDMDEELRFHLETYAADLLRQGLTREEAMRRAYAEFGGVEARKDDCREARGLRLVDEVQADVRYTFRQLRRAPVFTAVAILSLGLGIGANTAIFSLMEQALWKSMPVKAPEQLRLFTWVSDPPRRVMNSDWGSWSRPNSSRTVEFSESFSMDAFQAMRERASAFEQVFGFKSIGRVTVVIDGRAELIGAQLVSGNFYDGLGVVPIAGRAIDPGDDVVGRGDVVGLISDSYWARKFGRDPSIIGRPININQVPVTIVGVNPPGFTGVESGTQPDIFMPLTSQPRVFPWRYGKNPSLVNNPDYWWIGVMGRLRADVTEAQAHSETEAILQQVARELRDAHPDRKDASLPRLELLAGSRGLDNLREEFAQPLLLLLAFVGLVLLIACANVATLLLARAAVRRRELSLRLALGAGRPRIARQLLTEGLTLGIAGGLLGIAIGYVSRNTIPQMMMPAWSEDRFSAMFDARVLVLAMAVTIATSVLFSLAPIWQTRRVDINTALKDGGRGATRGSSAPMRGKSLIVFQVGLSVLLLIAAGLFIRTLTNLQAVNLGFKPERILLFTMDPPRTRYTGEARKQLFERIRQDLAAIPGVEEASLSATVLVSENRSRSSIALEGQTANHKTPSWENDIGHRFMETMGIPLVAGRSFDARDRPNSPLVAIVNQRWAREYYPETPNPVGRRFRVDKDTYEIIGMCGDASYYSVRTAVPPTMYRLFLQSTDISSMTFELRTSAATPTLMKNVRAVVDRIDRDLPVFDVRTQTQQIDATVSRERLFAMLTVAFGVLALVLASIGIYGLMAFNVSRRTSEIGIRIALGARRLDVLLMVLREASWLAIVGVVLGVASAVWLGRYIQAMLFGVEFADPIAIGAAIALMLMVALLAGWLPARRASRLDPMTALRHE